MQQADIEDNFRSSQDDFPPHLLRALDRGIGVHHASLPKWYRQGVERLFRQKKLGVVFATGTLAMGINMPSKTSVLIGDAVYLNAMSYRQMTGRAGRRGFDLRGNIVFMGISSEKCFRLLRSDLPKLQGNLVMDNSLALRLMIRQHFLCAKSKCKDPRNFDRAAPCSATKRCQGCSIGIRSCSRLMNYPLFNPLGPDSQLMRSQMAHCFRFSIEYLLRLGLLRVVENSLEPNDLGAFVAHLFFMEPANFAFLALLCHDDGRALKFLCRPGRANREEIVLSILCNIFCQLRLPNSLAKRAKMDKASTGPSKVVLDQLSEIGDYVDSDSRNGDGSRIREGQWVKEILVEHASGALNALVSYTACFVHAYREEMGPDVTLPLSGCTFPQPIVQADLGERWRSLLLPPVSVRSSFVALSGYSDIFSSVDELCETARSGLFLDPKMVPIFEPPDEDAGNLNSYLLDFYKHGQKNALVRYNKIDADTLWDELQSFSLVLKALSAAMERRSGTHTGKEVPFDDQNVLETFKIISQRFSERLQNIAA